MGSGSGRLGLGGRVGTGLLDDLPAQARADAACASSSPLSPRRGSQARWSGPIDVSADRLPYFGTVPGTRIHYGAGYSGNGVGPSWLGGQILASLALGARGRVDGAAARRPAGQRRLPPEPFRYVGGRLVRWGTLPSRRRSRRAGAVARCPCRGGDATPAADADRDAMRRASARLLVLVLAGCGGAATSSRASGSNAVELVEALQKGGYVVYLRHAATDRSKEDDVVLDLDDCTTQRNLAGGPRPGAADGRAFRQLAIPVDRGPRERVLPHARDRRARLRRATLEPALTGFPEEATRRYEERVRQTSRCSATRPPRERTSSSSHT